MRRPRHHRTTRITAGFSQVSPIGFSSLVLTSSVNVMHSYTAYGLGIHSALELRELVKRETRADVVIGLGAVNFTRPPGADGADWVWATRAEACVDYPEIARFHIKDGKEITIDA